MEKMIDQMHARGQQDQATNFRYDLNSDRMFLYWPGDVKLYMKEAMSKYPKQ